MQLRYQAIICVRRVPSPRRPDKNGTPGRRLRLYGGQLWISSSRLSGPCLSGVRRAAVRRCVPKFAALSSVGPREMALDAGFPDAARRLVPRSQQRSTAGGMTLAPDSADQIRPSDRAWGACPDPRRAIDGRCRQMRGSCHYRPARTAPPVLTSARRPQGPFDVSILQGYGFHRLGPCSPRQERREP